MNAPPSPLCEFVFNGAPYQLAHGSTLADLVEQLALSGQALALAVERQVVPRRQWRAHAIAPGARIELVRAIGGG